MIDNTSNKISIIIPVYNDDCFIGPTIKSVIDQTYDNYEIIVINDCSNDDSFDIVSKLKEPRIKIINNDANHGAAYSRNIGIKNATGDYIAFLDGDDLWKKDKLERQLDFMVSNGYDFSATSYDLIDEEGKPLGRVVSGPSKINHRKFMRSNYVGCLTVMYKREAYPDLQIPENIYKRNDYALWLKLSEKCECHFLKENLASYRKRKHSISSSKKTTMFRSHIDMFISLYNYSKFRAFWCALRNVFFYYWRRLKYSKKI